MLLSYIQVTHDCRPRELAQVSNDPVKSERYGKYQKGSRNLEANEAGTVAASFDGFHVCSFRLVRLGWKWLFRFLSDIVRRINLVLVILLRKTLLLSSYWYLS
jgi:hypothetical protein